MSKQRAGKELAILFLIEPGALDVEELEARHEARQCERVDRELGDRLVGAGIRFVVEDMNRAVANLNEVDVPGDYRDGAGCFLYRRCDWTLEAQSAPPVLEESVMGSTADKIKGIANKAAGKVKQGVGKAVGSEKMQAKGKVQELKGVGQEAMGQAKGAVKDTANKATKTINKKL